MSEQTVDLLTASGVREMSCDYLGEKVLARSFRTSALYRLRRAYSVV